jgi:hypothetical protein
MTETFLQFKKEAKKTARKTRIKFFCLCLRVWRIKKNERREQPLRADQAWQLQYFDLPNAADSGGKKNRKFFQRFL